MEGKETAKDYINNIDQQIRDKMEENGLNPNKEKTILTVGRVQKRAPRLIEVSTPEPQILPRIKPKKLANSWEQRLL